MASITRARWLRALAGLAVVGMVVAGCSAHPGAAAVVDGQEISESHLAEAVRDFELVTGQAPEAVAMLSTLVVAPTILEAASEFGIGVSEQQAVELLDAQVEAGGRTPPADGYADGVVQVAQMTLLSQQVQSSPDAGEINDRIAERIAEADVEVNPRYGEITPDGQIQPASYPWLTTATTPEG